MYSIVASDGKTYGPVDVPTLRTWCSEGRLTPNTTVIDAVSGRTMRAVDLHELYDLFAAPPQPSMQPSPPSMRPPDPVVMQPGGMPGGLLGTGGGAFGPGPQGIPNPYGSAYSQAPGHYGSPYGAPIVGHKSKVVAALLAFFLGIFGVQRFYLGYNGIGIAQLLITVLGTLFCGVGIVVSFIWGIADMILILTGSLRDAAGFDLA